MTPTVLLLDRDGTLMDDVGYPKDPTTVRLIPGAAEAIRQLVACGYRPAVVSNQSGVGRGWITQAEMDAVHERFVAVFRDASGVTLPAYYCPHAVGDGCACRKPRPGLLRQAAAELGLSQAPGIMIGDKPTDVAAGLAVGYRTIWLAFGREYALGDPTPSFIAKDWSAVLNWLLHPPFPELSGD